MTRSMIFTFRQLLLLCTVACCYSFGESATSGCFESTDGDHEVNVRLIGFNSTMAGNVEVCSEGVWRKLIISDVGSWSRKNSIVVCRELGYLNALHLSNNERYILKSSSSTGDKSPYHVVECSGLEETLLDCTTKKWNSSERILSVFQWPLVVCDDAPSKGDVRLVGDGSDSKGIVQIYHPNTIYKWSTLCTNNWDDNDAGVVCKQFGYQSGKSVLHKGNQNSLPQKRYDNFDCDGSETTLDECSFDGPYPLKCFSGANEYAGVECQENDQNSTPIGITDPRISLLVLITGVILILIAVMGMLLRCTVKRCRKKRSALPMAQSRDCQSSGEQSLQRVTLSSQYWQHNGVPNSITVDAPPTYEETVSIAVQSSDNSIESDVDTLETDINTHETDINTHQTDMDTHRTDIDTHRTDIDT